MQPISPASLQRNHVQLLVRERLTPPALRGLSIRHLLWPLWLPCSRTRASRTRRRFSARWGKRQQESRASRFNIAAFASPAMTAATSFLSGSNSASDRGRRESRLEGKGG